MSSINAAGSGHGHAQLAAEVSTRVAAKAQDAAKQQGAQAIALLQDAAEVQRAAEPGKGEKIDTLA